MNKVLEELKVAVQEYFSPKFKRLDEAKKEQIENKIEPYLLIGRGIIVDEKQATEWLALINLVYEWTIDNPFGVYHTLTFEDDGSVTVYTQNENCVSENRILYVNQKVALKQADERTVEYGTPSPQVHFIMNHIEAILYMQ